MSWATGALLSLFGSTAGNLGVNCQKYSLTLEGRKPLGQRRPFYKQKRYVLGLALIIFGSLGDFAALSMVAQSVIAPLGSFTLVANICFAHFWLHEHVGWRELIGTALIICGSVLSVVFGNHSDPTYTNQELLDLISGGLFISYAVVVLSFILIGVILHIRLTPLKSKLVELEAAAFPPPLHKPGASPSSSGDAKSPVSSSSHSNSNANAAPVRNNMPNGGAVRSAASPVAGRDTAAAHTHTPTPAPAPVLDVIPSTGVSTAHGAVNSAHPALHRTDTIANLDTGATAVSLVPTAEPSTLDLSELPALRLRWAKWAKFHPFMLAALSGTVGAQSILFSKCFSVLFATTVAGDNQLNNIFPWVCFICMLICIFSQLYFMTQALGFYDSLYVVPVFQVFFIFMSAAGGAAYFREVHNFTMMQTIMFPVGFAITLAGVAVLTFRSRKEKIERISRQNSKIAAAAVAAEREAGAADASGAGAGAGHADGAGSHRHHHQHNNHQHLHPAHSPGGLLTRDSASDDIAPGLSDSHTRGENEAAAGLAIRLDSHSNAGHAAAAQRQSGRPAERSGLLPLQSPVSDLESYRELNGGDGDADPDADGRLDVPAHNGLTPMEALVHAAQEQKAPTYARSPHQDSDTREVVFHDAETGRTPAAAEDRV